MKRYLSIPFLLAIPGNFLMAGVGLITIYSLLNLQPIARDRWMLFGTGVAAGLILVGSLTARKLRTAIHELKHWILVKLTGNKVKDFHVTDTTGHVKYVLYADRAHFAPMITLAPYFFPLFSLPMLGACLLLEGSYPLYLNLALGLALAADISTAVAELHPHQTDFNAVRGGFLACAAYLAGAHLLWVTCCLIWVAGGSFGFLHAGYLLWQLIERVAVAG